MCIRDRPEGAGQTVLPSGQEMEEFGVENAIQIKNLTKKYKDFSLKQITMNIPEGCVMGLIGENGAGKSTMIQAILGLIKADYEEISILGKDLRTQERLSLIHI